MIQASSVNIRGKGWRADGISFLLMVDGSVFVSASWSLLYPIWGLKVGKGSGQCTRRGQVALGCGHSSLKACLGAPYPAVAGELPGYDLGDFIIWQILRRGA